MNPSIIDHPLLITDEPALLAAIEKMAAADFLALDTEFVRESTYFPKLCLVQVATVDQIWILDPLALPNLHIFWRFLLDYDKPLVLHSAEQDLELIFQSCGKLPRNLFDTQMAAALLGLGEQIGYAALVQKLCGVELDKTHSRTDWTQRPLSDEQIHYAADDVRYLREIYPKLRTMLAEQGREDWLAEDFRALSDPTRFITADDEQWKRVKHHQQLKGKQLAILQDLAAWREATARKQNLPRRWILPDELLVDLARIAPTSRGQLDRLRGWPKNAQNRYGDVLLELIQKSAQRPRSDWPVLRIPSRASQDEETILALLQAVIKHCAATQNIAVNTLANSSELLALLRGQQDLAILHGWRRRIAGETLLSVLDGRTALTVTDGRLCLIDNPTKT